MDSKNIKILSINIFSKVCLTMLMKELYENYSSSGVQGNLII